MKIPAVDTCGYVF